MGSRVVRLATLRKLKLRKRKPYKRKRLAEYFF